MHRAGVRLSRAAWGLSTDICRRQTAAGAASYTAIRGTRIDTDLSDPDLSYLFYVRGYKETV